MTTTTSHARRTTYVWVFLSAITMLSLWLGHARAGEAYGASVPITMAVLAIAAIKCRFIIQEFMEVRTAPRWLRLSTDAWLVALWGAVLAIYLW